MNHAIETRERRAEGDPSNLHGAERESPCREGPYRTSARPTKDEPEEKSAYVGLLIMAALLVMYALAARG